MTGPVGLGVEVVVCCFFVCVYVNKHFLKIPYSDDGQFRFIVKSLFCLHVTKCMMEESPLAFLNVYLGVP